RLSAGSHAPGAEGNQRALPPDGQQPDRPRRAGAAADSARDRQRDLHGDGSARADAAVLETGLSVGVGTIGPRTDVVLGPKSEVRGALGSPESSVLRVMSNRRRGFLVLASLAVMMLATAARATAVQKTTQDKV